MSRDIRSYFCSSKLSAPKKSDTEDKPRKKAKKVILSDEDDDSNPSKSKKAKSGDHTKTKANDNKGRSKKRAILSSDEDENEDTSHGKNKKVKVSSLSKSFNHVEKPVEEIVDPEQVFSKKPVKRINAPTIIKKFSDEQVKQSSASSTKVAFMDDDFDATLNQLDTSQIEDDYLSTITNKNKENGTSEKNTKDEHKSDDEKNGNDVIVSKKKEKDISDIKDKNKSADERISPSNKNKSKEKNHSETKNEKSKEKKDKSYSKKKKKDISNGKLEVEKEAKSNKANDKSKDVDYNDIIQEKIEKKKQHAILYQNYLNRGGARNPGSKKIPKGAEQCLANLTFLITGVLESLEREETEGIIKQYGGKVVHSVSKKLNYLIIGEEAGPSKLAKAANLGIKEISEDDFLDLLRTRPSNVESKKSASSDNNNKRKRDNSSSNDDTKGTETAKKIKEDSSPKNKHRSPHKAEKHKEDLSSKDNHTSPKEIKESKYPSPNHEVSKEISSTQSSKTEEKKANSIIINKISESSTSKIEDKEDNKPFINNLSNKIDDAVDHITALVEKYRPKEMKNIIGQTGDKSNAKKLQFWLTNWHKNHGKDSKVSKPKFSAKDDTGTIYKAALLSGPPGIGKTTTAYVVCTQLGYEVLEFNASDTRSKKLLQEEVSGILSNKTVKSFLTKTVDTKKTPPKHVLLMDEVDGMAGNEDRGGMQELIAFIKSTEVPIICICNDRNSPKIRTLSNYTFDLRFQKPRLEQIRAAMMSICYKEGIKITPEELTQIIHSTNQDIRQVINHIAILSAKSQTKAESAEKLKYKNLKLGPWDVVRKVFSTEEHKNMSIHDKSDLFFHDYNIAALFVEENYPIVTPAGPTAQIYEKLAKCSESLAIGDTIEKNIRSNQAWGLLPVQAIFSSVIPGSVMSGYLNSQINFPSWLGRNSKSSKCDRLLQDITVHARITTGASKEAINLDYLKMLVDSIVRPLAIEGTEGVDKAVDIMNKYHLSREDLDSLIELTKWPHTRDPMQAVDSKTKTAFTKAYNKSSSFSSAGTMKKKSTRDLQGNGLDGSDEEQLLDDNEDNEKIENDKLIKAKASKAKSAPSGSKSKAKTVKNTASHSKKNN